MYIVQFVRECIGFAERLRSGSCKKKILHDHHGERQMRKKSRTDKMEENRDAAVSGSTFFTGGNDNALEPYIIYMLKTWAEVSSKHPGMTKTKNSLALKLSGDIGGNRVEGGVSFEGKEMNFSDITRWQRGVHVRSITGRRAYTDWAKVAAEGRKKRAAAENVKKPWQDMDIATHCDAGICSGFKAKPAEVRTSSTSAESENDSMTDLNTSNMAEADGDGIAEEEAVDGFLIEASNALFPLKKMKPNKVSEEEERLQAKELQSLEARFGIEVLSVKG